MLKIVNGFFCFFFLLLSLAFRFIWLWGAAVRATFLPTNWQQRQLSPAIDIRIRIRIRIAIVIAICNCIPAVRPCVSGGGRLKKIEEYGPT